MELIEQRIVLEKEFNIYGDYENPLFLAKDVAEWIEHTHTTTMLKSIDTSEKLNVTILHAGQRREVIMLTEDGLYEVLMQSRKHIAKAFKKEVKKILKDIRKHGMYAKDDLLDNPDLFIEALQKLKAEKAKNKELQMANTQKDQIIGELKPKADYMDIILRNKSLVTITQIAKDYGLSGLALNKILHNHKIQYKQSGQWLLYREYHDKGYTHSETVAYKHRDGTSDVKMNTKWTQKGRLFIHELLKLQCGILPVIERGSNT